MLRSSESAVGRSWIAAGRWMGAEVLQGGFYQLLCPWAIACSPYLEGTESKERLVYLFPLLLAGLKGGREICDTAGASSDSPFNQFRAFDLADIHTTIFTKGLKIKKEKNKRNTWQ